MRMADTNGSPRLAHNIVTTESPLERSQLAELSKTLGALVRGPIRVGAGDSAVSYVFRPSSPPEIT